MIVFLMFASIVFGIVIGYLIVSRKPKNAFLALAEYWIFLPGKEMPDQNAMMDRTIGKNPYRHRSRETIKTTEGLVFSDVRLHIALVLRKRNPHAFRPDLFNDATPTPEILEALAKAESMVKVRFASEDRLKDNRHLQFLPHLADAIAELADGSLIYDATCERFLMRPELVEILSTKPDVSGPEVHVAIRWHQEADAGYAETRGLLKIGRKELRTPSTPSDQRILVMSILEDAVKTVWSEAALPASMEVEAFDDRFRVLFEPTKTKFTRVRIQRLRSA